MPPPCSSPPRYRSAAASWKVPATLAGATITRIAADRRKRLRTRHRGRPGQVIACPAAFLVAFLAAGTLAGCVSPPARPPVVAVARPAPAAPPDWFQRQMILAREARRTHLPHDDVLGARQAYFRVALGACQHIVQPGLAKYRARCNALMRQSVASIPARADAPDCDENADDPDKITACND